MNNELFFFNFYNEFQLGVPNPIDNNFKQFLNKIKIECKNSIRIIKKANLKKKNREIDFILVKNNIKGLKAILWYIKERSELSEIKGIKKINIYDIPKKFRNLIENSENDQIDEDLKALIKNSNQ